MEKLAQIVKFSAKYSVLVALFLGLIQPFGIDTMKEGRIMFILAETALSFLSIIISEWIVYQLAGKTTEVNVSRVSIIKHLCLTNAINIPLLGAFLLTFNSWHYTGNMWSYWWYQGHFNLSGFGTMSLYVGCISVFLMMFVYFSFRTSTLRNELEEVKAINLMLEQRQQRLEEETIDSTLSTPEAEASEAPITIVGQGQDATLTLHPRSLIYVESMANYADICYIHDNEIQHKTLRITLKQIRETLQDEPSIVQCHRAFLVNINFVVAMQNDKTSNYLQLFGMEKHIPVSRANTETIKDSLKLHA